MEYYSVHLTDLSFYLLCQISLHLLSFHLLLHCISLRLNRFEAFSVLLRSSNDCINQALHTVVDQHPGNVSSLFFCPFITNISFVLPFSTIQAEPGCVEAYKHPRGEKVILLT